MRMRTIRIWHVPRGTLRAEKIWEKAWLSQIFGAGAPVVRQRLYSGGLHLVPREFAAIGVVYFQKIGAGAPVVVQQRFVWWDLRRLYSAQTSMSSLICRNGENSLKLQSSPAPIIQYSSYAVKYYLQIAAGLGKLR